MFNKRRYAQYRDVGRAAQECSTVKNQKLWLEEKLVQIFKRSDLVEFVERNGGGF